MIKDLPDEALVCNCADCGTLLLGAQERKKKWFADLSSAEKRLVPPTVSGRIKDRPYCSNCLNLRSKASYRIRYDKLKGFGLETFSKAKEKDITDSIIKSLEEKKSPSERPTSEGPPMEGPMEDYGVAS